MAEPEETYEPEVYIDVAELFEEAGDYSEALSIYQEAWESLPEPKHKHEYAINLMIAIANCHYHLDNWEEWQSSMKLAMYC